MAQREQVIPLPSPEIFRALDRNMTDEHAVKIAAEVRGRSVSWYDREPVFRDAAAVLGCEDINAFLLATGRSIGPPWQAKHKLAAAAALAATEQPAR